MTIEKTSVAIEVALAFPEEQHIVSLKIPCEMTITEAINISGIFDKFVSVPEDVRNLEHGVGVFGKEIKNHDEYKIKDGDRIEIYRPLTIDPKEARINRAQKKAEPSNNKNSTK